MKRNRIKIGECKARARKALLGNYTLVIGAGILAILLPAALFMLAAASLAFAMHGDRLAGILVVPRTAAVTCGSVLFSASLLLGIVTAVFCGYGVTRLYINICRGRDFGLTDIFYPFRSGSHPWRVVGVKLIMWIITAVCLGIAALAGGMLGVLAATGASSEVGIVCKVLAAAAAFVYIFVYVTFYLSDLIIIDRPGTGVFEAFGQSARLMKGHKLKGIWFIVFSFIFWRMLMAFCSIASLWVLPYMACTRIFFYMSAEGTLEETPRETAGEVIDGDFAVYEETGEPAADGGAAEDGSASGESGEAGDSPVPGGEGGSKRPEPGGNGGSDSPEPVGNGGSDGPEPGGNGGGSDGQEPADNSGGSERTEPVSGASTGEQEAPSYPDKSTADQERTD